MDELECHPMRYIIDKAYALSKPTQNIAVLSPLAQSSFVFHLALAELHRRNNDNPDSTVTVIGTSKASFQQALIDENDTLLKKDLSNDELADLLDRIDFRFCENLPQLIALLCHFAQPATNFIGPSDSLEDQNSKRIAIIITDLTAYLNSRPTTLAELTRLLGFISSTQVNLPLKHPPGALLPVYLIDRMKGTEDWSVFGASNSDHASVIRKIFQHFFQQTWFIDYEDSGTSNFDRAQRYRMQSSSGEGTLRDQVIYKVLEETPHAEFSAGVAVPLRRTVIVEEM